MNGEAKLNETVKEKNGITYIEGIYLLNVLNRIPILDIDQEIRGDLYKLKKTVLDIHSEFEEEKTFMLLMNGGIEKTNKDGQKYYDAPDYQTRTEFKGSDKEYEDHLIKTKNIKSTLTKLIQELADKKSSIVIKPFLTNKQFDALLTIIPSLDFNSLKTVLVKN